MSQTRRPNRNPPTLSEWGALSPWGRWVITWHCWQALHRPMWPVFFSLASSGLTFGFLSWMPLHPMTIPVAFGAGLSITIIARGFVR